MINRYADLAERHFRTYRPKQYRQLVESGAATEFFDNLGLEASEQVEVRSDAYLKANPIPPGADFLTRRAALHTARVLAESEVLREVILLPDEETEADACPPKPSESGSDIPYLIEPHIKKRATPMPSPFTREQLGDLQIRPCQPSDPNPVIVIRPDRPSRR